MAGFAAARLPLRLHPKSVLAYDVDRIAVLRNSFVSAAAAHGGAAVPVAHSVNVCTDDAVSAIFTAHRRFPAISTPRAATWYDTFHLNCATTAICQAPMRIPDNDIPSPSLHALRARRLPRKLLHAETAYLSPTALSSRSIKSSTPVSQTIRNLCIGGGVHGNGDSSVRSSRSRYNITDISEAPQSLSHSGARATSVRSYGPTCIGRSTIIERRSSGPSFFYSCGVLRGCLRKVKGCQSKSGQDFARGIDTCCLRSSHASSTNTDSTSSRRRRCLSSTICTGSTGLQQTGDVDRCSNDADRCPGRSDSVLRWRETDHIRFLKGGCPPYSMCSPCCPPSFLLYCPVWRVLVSDTNKRSVKSFLAMSSNTSLFSTLCRPLAVPAFMRLSVYCYPSRRARCCRTKHGCHDAKHDSSVHDLFLTSAMFMWLGPLGSRGKGWTGWSDTSTKDKDSSWVRAAAALIAVTTATAALREHKDSQKQSDSGIQTSPWRALSRSVTCSSSSFNTRLYHCRPTAGSRGSPSSSLTFSPPCFFSPAYGTSRASVLLFPPPAGSLTPRRGWRPSVRANVFVSEKPPSRCCGIVGYLGDKEALPLLLQGLEILQNRGYDSCGISSVSDMGGALITTKFASRGSTCDSLNILREQAQQAHAGNRIGIGHTRWATHGSKTDANAHPHHDWKDRVSVVHNGTIDNFASLKQALQRQGCTFRSETDTEVIANLIGWHLENGATFEEAVNNAVGEIQGTWGLCVLHKDYPDRLILARNGSPLLVGAAAGGQVFVASEPAALAQHTNQYMMLKDGEIAVITAEGVGHLEATRPVHSIGIEEKIELSPDPFPHWTIKEIYEQPQALARAMNYGGRIAPYRSAVKLGGLDQSREALLAIKNLLICGCGTSLYAAMYGELIMQWLGSLPQVRAVDASELELYAFPKDDAGVLLLSQSGETLDTVRACQLAETKGIKKFSVVNQVGSLLARLTDCGVYVNAGREVAVASTKAFSCQVTVLSLIAAWFFQNRTQHPVSQQHADRCAAMMDAIQRLPVYAGMTLNCRSACTSVAAKLVNAKTIFVLGKGFGYPVALEGALKIKEVGCIHAEGFAAGALKHGPFALIDEAAHTPVVMILLGDHHAAYMLNAAQQVKARGAHLICITDVPEAVSNLADDVLVVPSNGPLTALLACIPLQLLAYELAVAKGLNPDKPRGLAKTVTVF